MVVSLESAKALREGGRKVTKSGLLQTPKLYYIQKNLPNPLVLSVFVFKNVSKDANDKKQKIIYKSYIAPFDTFYYVTLRRTLRASGMEK